MAYSYDDLLIRQGQRLQGERAQAMAELEARRQNEDINACDYAADRILKIDQDYARLEQIASQYVARQLAVPFMGDDISARDAALAQRHGLTAQEIGVAKNWTSDPKL